MHGPHDEDEHQGEDNGEALLLYHVIPRALTKPENHRMNRRECVDALC
jgi:hypothetical protein